MKRLILFAVLIIATIQFSFAQNTIAKLKFEEAEEAYANNNFELTLTKLNEVETLLKATNPKILYLQILAQAKIIEKNPLANYHIIENARTSINKYLKDYENLPDNEDKYREIYKISENFKNYPNSLQDFNEIIKENELKAAAKKQAEVDEIKRGEDAFMNYVYFKYYKIGLTLEEMKIEFPEFFKKCSSYKYKELMYDRAYSSSSVNGPTIYGKNGKIVGYSGTAQGRVQDDANFTKGDKAIAEIVEELTTKFNFSPVKTNTPYNDGTYKFNSISYHWEKNGKTIDIIYVQHYFSNGFTTDISLTQWDNEIAKPSQLNSGEIAKPSQPKINESQQNINELAKQFKSNFGLFK